MKWTSERLELLRTLRDDPSLTNADIAARLGTSECSATDAARRSKMPSRVNLFLKSDAGRLLHREAQRAKSRHTPEKIEKIRQMYADGLSAGGIGKLIGEPKNVICGLKKRYGFERRAPLSDPLWSADEDTILRAGVGEGLSHKEIAMRLPRRTAKGVRSRCASIGLSAAYREAQELRFRRRIKRHHREREAAERRAKPRSNIFMVNLAHKRIAVKAMEPMRSIVCESVPFTPEHRGCAWLTSDGRPWMACANKRSFGRAYCSDHFMLSIGAVDPEPDEPAEAIPMLEAA